MHWSGGAKGVVVVMAAGVVVAGLVVARAAPWRSDDERVTYTVTSDEDVADRDVGDGACDTGASPPAGACTLRAAVQEANASRRPATIEVGQRYVLRTERAEPDDVGAAGDLDVHGDVRIVGTDAERSVIDAGGIDAMFQLHDGATLTLEKLTVVGGQTPAAPHVVAGGTARFIDVITTDDRAGVQGRAVGLDTQARRAVALCGLGSGKQTERVGDITVSDPRALEAVVGGIF